MANRKFEWPILSSGKDVRSVKISRRIVYPLAFVIGRIWAKWLNRATVYNIENLHRRIDHLPKKTSRPLITISNHQSCLDDPLIWSALLKWKHYTSSESRWIPAASEILFPNRALSFVGVIGRCVPVTRGLGVYQDGMDFCLEKLNQSKWLHLFPEGKINLTDDRRLKWGIGRLMAESHQVPDVIPFWFLGMDDILPNKKPYLPRFGKTLTVYIGEPMNIREKVEELRLTITDPMDLRRQITDLIETEFWKLKEFAEPMHKKSKRTLV